MEKNKTEIRNGFIEKDGNTFYSEHPSYGSLSRYCGYVPSYIKIIGYCKILIENTEFYRKTSILLEWKTIK